MNFVVLDLEWNQAMSSKSEVFNRLPIHLRGEIIEIGAVKLNPDLSLGEEFTIDVRPVYFRRMHYKVKKITGFDKDRLSHGVGFPEAMARLREWCGDGVTFLTWGWDDQGIFEQNIIIHDLDWDWIAGWVNLQMIYNLQTGGDKNQKSLASAMEHFGIEQTRVAHDALGDAYNTALVTTHLDMEEGMRLYPEAEAILAQRMPNYKPPQEPEFGQEALVHDSSPSYESKAEAFADASVEALNRCFDKYRSSPEYADLLYELTLNDASGLLALTIDEATLALGTDFTIEALGENALTITIAKEALLALGLATTTNAVDGTVIDRNKGY